MSVLESNFSNYNLVEIAEDPQGVYGLVDRLLPRIAEEGFSRPVAINPSTEELSDLIGLVGKQKELQKNIPNVEGHLGADISALHKAAYWTDRSGVLLPLSRSFVDPDRKLPNKIDAVVITGGVARWMLRRLFQVETVVSQRFDRINRVHLMTGNREMKDTEHEMVAELSGAMGRQLTESDFARKILVPRLTRLGLRVGLTAVASASGDEVFGEGISQNPRILEGNITVIGNAPSATMTTGQFYLNAHEHDPSFNSNGDQLFMLSDSYPLATTEQEAKIPATFQNPYTALGQIARNALILHKSAKTTESR